MKILKQMWIAIMLLTTMCLSAQEYCLSSAFGYGASATGGYNIIKVSTLSELKTAVSKAGSLIIITNDIAFKENLQIKASNITIIGAKADGTAVTLSNSNADQGIFSFKDGGKNYIIRNINFKGPSSATNQGGDLVAFSDNSGTAWIDHCTFDDGSDGNFDITKGSNNITVTWCYFKYSTFKGTEPHNFSNLVGSSSSDENQYKSQPCNVTFAYCWWGEGIRQRMTRSRNAGLHFLNCYWNSSKADYYIGLENSSAYVEGCHFSVLSGKKILGTGNSWYTGASHVFVNCTVDEGKSKPTNAGSVSKPSYSYPTALTAAEAVAAVKNSSCGAGATLIVNQSTGACSSPCDANMPNISVVGNLQQTVSTGSAISSITLTAGGSATSINYSGSIAGITATKTGNTITISGTPTASGTITITASDGVNTITKTISITIKQTTSTLTPISVATTWIFSDLGSTDIKLDETTTPEKGKDFIFSNVEKINPPSSFNASALLGNGEYIVRNGSFFQGAKLMFTAGVAGTVTVTFSNTGSSNGTRYLAINGVTTSTGANKTTMVTSSAIAVGAGDVTIEGDQDKTGKLGAYLRVSKIVFTPTTTGISETFTNENEEYQWNISNSSASINSDAKQIFIMDSIGNKILSANASKIDITSLEKGFYIAVVQLQDGKLISKKFVK